MKKLIVLSAGVLAAPAVMMLVGTGIAAADEDVVGKTVEEAQSALSDAGKTAKINTKVGDKQDLSSCLVTSAIDAPFVGGTDGTHVSDKVLLNINCYGASASAAPGISQADRSTAAKAVKDAEAQAAAESEAGVTSANQR